MTEQAIEEQVRDLRARKNGAMEKLVDAYTQPLMAGAFVMGFSEADAEELVQETFVAFLKAVERFEGRSQLKTYLFGILYNKASDMRRKRAREDSLDEIQEDYEKRFDPKGMWAKPPQGPEDSALTQEIQGWIEKCAEKLSARQRAAFFLREAEGESSEDICNILGVTYTNLRVLMYGPDGLQGAGEKLGATQMIMDGLLPTCREVTRSSPRRIRVLPHGRCGCTRMCEHCGRFARQLGLISGR